MGHGHASAAESYRPGVAFSEIPVVALSDWSSAGADRATFADRLRGICHEIGFFRLVEHGVDPAFLDDYFSAMRSFFALPSEAKAQIDKQHSPWFRGWERVGAELTDNAVDYREQIDVWSELPARNQGDGPSFLRLEGPNQWPTESVAPGFRSLVERFQTEMAAVADQLMSAMSVGLGLPDGYLHDLFGERRMSLVKLIHYPPTPDGGAGVNPHHDTGFLTLLWQHGVRGLEVMNEDGAWIEVPIDNSAIVVNLGEMLQTITGNYYVATNHRVIAHHERYSSAYFHGPELDTMLTPLPLDESFSLAVAGSDRHRSAGFMARREELLNGAGGLSSTPADSYGQQLWNYFVRSYPELVQRHHPDLSPLN